MSTDIQAGMFVKLKSGGPAMTATIVVGRDVSCQWFSGDELKSGAFKISSLTAAAEATSLIVNFD